MMTQTAVETLNKAYDQALLAQDNFMIALIDDALNKIGEK